MTIRSGAEVTCLFTNAFIPRGAISLAKITEGNTGTTSFQVTPVTGKPAHYVQIAVSSRIGVPVDAVHVGPTDATDHLRLGAHRIIEQHPHDIPAGGWTLTKVVCNGVDVPFAQGIVVTLTRSQPSARCVFTDTFTRTPPPEPPPEPPAPPPPEPLPRPDRTPTSRAHRTPTYPSPSTPRRRP